MGCSLRWQDSRDFRFPVRQVAAGLAGARLGTRATDPISGSPIKTVPEVPLSHPFIDRLVSTIRRELLDQVPFLSAENLERKLLHIRDYHNRDRVHASLGGATPACKAPLISVAG
jgi:transposase InsO family protein